MIILYYERIEKLKKKKQQVRVTPPPVGPIIYLQWIARLRVSLVHTAGSPYVNPHVQRNSCGGWYTNNIFILIIIIFRADRRNDATRVKKINKKKNRNIIESVRVASVRANQINEIDYVIYVHIIYISSPNIIIVLVGTCCAVTATRRRNYITIYYCYKYYTLHCVITYTVHVYSGRLGGIRVTPTTRRSVRQKTKMFNQNRYVV